MANRDRYDSVKDWAAVVALFGETESVRLECKKKRNPASPDLEQDDIDNLGKTVSAFANVSGGLLIFGLDTTHPTFKSQSPVITRDVPIADAATFATKVENQLLRVVDPMVAGRDVKPILHADGSGRGVVLVHVPESFGGPHRVINGSTSVNERYYMRTASSSVIMPHALLAALFGRVPPPRLRFRIARPDVRYLQIAIENTGRGMGKNVLARVKISAGPEAVAKDFDVSLPWMREFRSQLHEADSYSYMFYLPPPKLIYPDELQWIGKCELLHALNVRIYGRIDSEGAAPTRFEAHVDLVEGANSVRVPATDDPIE